MKLRSLLLVICMLVVPALAMFSHWIPADVRAAARRSFASATSGWLGTPAQAGTVTPSVATPPAAAGQPALSGQTLDTTRFLPAATAHSTTSTGLPPTATGLPPAATGGPATSNVPLAIGPTPTSTPEPATPPLVAQLADRTRQLREQQAREQQAIEAQLKSAGAVAFDCQPLPGSDGLFSSSCRVPVDATGQLQRVFQASGPDPGGSAAALLAQVTAWRQRMVAQQPAAAAADSADPIPDGRFR